MNGKIYLNQYAFLVVYVRPSRNSLHIWLCGSFKRGSYKMLLWRMVEDKKYC